MEGTSKRNRWLRAGKIFLGVILSIVLILYIILRSGMIDFTMDKAEIEEYFSQSKYKPEYHTYSIDDHNLHYVSVGNKNRPTMLFIHGSPGTWDAFTVYMRDQTLQERYHMISVDRIGYGNSEPGNPEPSLYLQAKYLQPIIESLPDSLPLIVAGHSYGGPVAVRLAMEYPRRIDGLLLLAGLADPEHENRPIYQYWLRTPALRWLLPKDLDVSNREIVPLKEELRMILPLWPRIQSETIIIQGTKDILVDAKHAAFTEQKLEEISAGLTYLIGANHFFIWTQPEMVKFRLMELMGCIQSKYQKREFY